jgi:CubicO group peptidase (beta-lactamase class C family)
VPDEDDGLGGVLLAGQDVGLDADNGATTTAGQSGFGPAWTAESPTVQAGTLEPGRGLFWHPAHGTNPADDIWVHYGFTGTGMWISPRQYRWAVLLTNKLYYTRATASP